VCTKKHTSGYEEKLFSLDLYFMGLWEQHSETFLEKNLKNVSGLGGLRNF
jgi:hypothetical protein